MSARPAFLISARIGDLGDVVFASRCEIHKTTGIEERLGFLEALIATLGYDLNEMKSTVGNLMKTVESSKGDVGQARFQVAEMMRELSSDNKLAMPSERL